MSIPTKFDGEEVGGDGEALLPEALALYEAAASMFRHAIEASRDGGSVQAMRAVGYGRDYRRALLCLMNERAKVEELCRKHSGPAEGRPLDLERAREEIGRRLARLRDAGNG